MDTGLKRQPVDDVIIQKILRFAATKETFTTKELFAQYPNNPELILRYGLNNLRIDEKIFMYGNKKGAYYSLKKELDATNKQAEKEEDENLKKIILDKIKKITGWFKTADLGLSEKFGHINILNTLHDLNNDNVILIRGAKRWTEYCLNSDSAQAELEKETPIKKAEKAQDGPKQDTRPSQQPNLKNKILNYIKKNKVVTIPMLIDETNEHRYIIMPYVTALEQEEEIYHEGNKRSSKYIYKDVSCSEVEEITKKLLEDQKIEQQIDELSKMLCANESVCFSIGFNNDNTFHIKQLANGSKISDKIYPTINDGFTSFKKLTEIVDNG